MDIKQLEFEAPNKANRFGKLTMTVAFPVLYEDIGRELDEAEDVEVEIPSEAVQLMMKAKALILDNLAKNE